MNAVESLRPESTELEGRSYSRPIPNLLVYLLIGMWIWEYVEDLPRDGDVHPSEVWPYALTFLALALLLMPVFAVRFENCRFRIEWTAFRDPVLWFFSPFLAFWAATGMFWVVLLLAVSCGLFVRIKLLWIRRRR